MHGVGAKVRPTTVRAAHHPGSVEQEPAEDEEQADAEVQSAQQAGQHVPPDGPGDEADVGHQDPEGRQPAQSLQGDDASGRRPRAVRGTDRGLVRGRPGGHRVLAVTTVAPGTHSPTGSVGRTSSRVSAVR